MEKQFIVIYFRNIKIHYKAFEKKEDAQQFKEATNGEVRGLQINSEEIRTSRALARRQLFSASPVLIHSYQ